ncbi:hypothetical protein [Streptomyces sp. SID3343]|uniref:hypothetical protein n=1 Tax=Streptomyces sp. SID3343 TaxID=2690260 RepID=UPI00136EA4CE|nr:hypothetical protein [Streptomyces sp. SID3343]MYW00601.1 hypothetical protein [Streptomyces sp. SID3343]
MSLPAQRTALIVDCEPSSAHPVVLRPLTPGAVSMRLTRAEAQHLIDDAAHVLDLLDAADAMAAADIAA